LFGAIEFTNLSNGTVRTWVPFRDHDGQLRRVEASDSTRKLAVYQLKEELTHTETALICRPFLSMGRVRRPSR